MNEVITTKINPNGRIVIPLAIRKALGVKPGDEVMMRLVDGELRVYTFDHTLERLCREMRQFIPTDAGAATGLVDELIQDRRAEVGPSAAGEPLREGK